MPQQIRAYLFMVILSIMSNHYTSAQNSVKIDDLAAEKIKIRFKDGSKLKGFVMSADQQDLKIITQKKLVKIALLNNCSSCIDIPLSDIEKAKIVSRKKKTFQKIGAAMSVLLSVPALFSRGTEDLSGVSLGVVTLSYYGVRLIGGGWLLDELVLNRSIKIKLVEHFLVNQDVLLSLTQRSPMHRQSAITSDILSQLKTIDYQEFNKRTFRVYLSNRQIAEGYIHSTGMDTIQISSTYPLSDSSRHIAIEDILFIEQLSVE